MNLIEEAEGVSLITPSRLENLVAMVELTCSLPGEMAELGVYRGGSALIISKVCPKKALYLFDTFRGLPHTESPEHNPTGHDLSEGRFEAELADVVALFSGRNASIHVGVFPDTTAGIEDVQFSFVHIDCDLYRSAKDGIEWFWPRMVSGGIMLFDDYGCDFTGVTDAVHEAFQESQIVKQYDRSNGFQIGAFVQKQ